jgi:hypothetical protein
MPLEALPSARPVAISFVVDTPSLLEPDTNPVTNRRLTVGSHPGTFTLAEHACFRRWDAPVFASHVFVSGGSSLGRKQPPLAAGAVIGLMLRRMTG